MWQPPQNCAWSEYTSAKGIQRVVATSRGLQQRQLIARVAIVSNYLDLSRQSRKTKMQFCYANYPVVRQVMQWLMHELSFEMKPCFWMKTTFVIGTFVCDVLNFLTWSNHNGRNVRVDKESFVSDKMTVQTRSSVTKKRLFAMTHTWKNNRLCWIVHNGSFVI